MTKHLTLLLFIGLAWGQPEKRHKIQPFKDNALLLNNSIFHPVNEIDYQRENWYLFQRLQQSWDGAQWVNNGQEMLTYDANGNLTNKIFQQKFSPSIKTTPIHLIQLPLYAMTYHKMPWSTSPSMIWWVEQSAHWSANCWLLISTLERYQW